jgi:hypothetical protein
MHKRTALAATVATTAIAAIGASSASAYTITGGPNFTGASANNTVLNDTTTGSALTCTSSSAGGTVNTGTGVGPTLGSISSLSFASCTGPLNITFTVTANSLPYPLVGTGATVSGVTPGQVTGVNARLSGPLCSATVTGTAAGSYSNTTRRLTLSGSPTLTISNVSGCFGLLNNGDTASFAATYNVVGSPTNPIAINN